MLALRAKKPKNLYILSRYIGARNMIIEDIHICNNKTYSTQPNWTKKQKKNSNLLRIYKHGIFFSKMYGLDCPTEKCEIAVTSEV